MVMSWISGAAPGPAGSVGIQYTYRVTFLKLATHLIPRISAEGSGSCTHMRGTTLGIQKGAEKTEFGGAGQRQRAGHLVNTLLMVKKLEPNVRTMTRLCDLKGLQRDTCKVQHDTHWLSKRF